MAGLKKRRALTAAKNLQGMSAEGIAVIPVKELQSTEEGGTGVSYLREKSVKPAASCLSWLQTIRQSRSGQPYHLCMRIPC